MRWRRRRLVGYTTLSKRSSGHDVGRKECPRLAIDRGPVAHHARGAPPVAIRLVGDEIGDGASELLDASADELHDGLHDDDPGADRE